MYFMQEAGEPLKLRYTKATYGPYAENLRHALTAMEGHFVTGYGDGADDPRRQIEIMSGAVREAKDFLATEPEKRDRLNRVAELIRGFETPFGLELLATVHWVASHEKTTNDADIVAHVYAWNKHKRMFREEQLRIAIQVLRNRGWLERPKSPSDVPREAR